MDCHPSLFHTSFIYLFQDPQTNRTLTLISKTIQSLGNLVSSGVCKEEYMVALYKCFCTERHVSLFNISKNILYY